MRRKIIDPDEKFQDGEIVESWSKVRVLVASFAIILLLGAGYFAFTKAKTKATQVLGIESGPRSINTSDVHLPTQDDANRLLENAKQELNNLTSGNLTSSQAALQRIITDLQSLQNGKENPTDLICHTICGK